MNRLVSTLALFALVLTMACQKKEETNYGTNSSQDNSKAENVFNGVWKDVQVAFQEENSPVRVSWLGSCAVATWDIANKTFTVDFGPVGCIGQDGRSRRGAIIVTYTDAYQTPGAVITTTFQDYYVSNYKVEGTQTVTNNGYNADNNLTYTVVVSNAVITAPNNAYQISWNSTRTREWIAGDNTNWDWTDDQYLITGSADGINRDGLPYTAQITTPVHFDLSCDIIPIIAGRVEVTPQGQETRWIDYGNGACDSQVTVGVGNWSIPVNIIY